MGVFTKSIIILLLAVSTPLFYRQFATDRTVKILSTYYSNFKSIDQLLRQSASHLDQAKTYLTNPEHLKNLAEKFSKQFDDLKAKPVSEFEGTASQASTGVRFTQCSSEKDSDEKIRLWSKGELALFDGSSKDNPDVYLGFLGLVYNVTVNAQHYAKGAEYNVFAGRDATRAFVTGNFTHDLHDDIKDIDSSLYAHVETWEAFYRNSYPVLGRIEGRFYDSQGCPTQELERVYEIFAKLVGDKQAEQVLDNELPECNSEWNNDLKQGRVWCSTKSGGVDREWTGVPRIYKNGDINRCACFNENGATAGELVEFMDTYPGCDPTATECQLKESL